jgi:hypothetical protein
VTLCLKLGCNPHAAVGWSVVKREEERGLQVPNAGTDVVLLYKIAEHSIVVGAIGLITPA